MCLKFKKEKTKIYDCHTTVQCDSLSASNPISDSATGGRIR